MRLKNLTLGILIGLVGCYASPTYEHNHILQLSPTPRSQDFISPYTLPDTASYLNYRNALLSYQLYLSGYIAHYDKIYKVPMVPTTDKLSTVKECPKPELIVLPNTPVITESMTESEINDVLFRHIQDLRATVKRHNTDLQ